MRSVSKRSHHAEFKKSKVRMERRKRRPQFSHWKLWVRRIRRDGMANAHEMAKAIKRTGQFWAVAHQLGFSESYET
jgi:hypothetical protein